MFRCFVVSPAPPGRASTKDRSSNCPPVPSMPRLVQFTSREHRGASRARVSPSIPAGASRPAGSPAHSCAARSGVRLQTYTRSAPARASLGAAARAAPPAPSSSTVRPAGSSPASRRARRKPSPSVLWPSARPFRRRTVFTAPYPRASSVRVSIRGTRCSLWGMVALKPTTPSALAAARKAAVSPPGTRRAVYAYSPSSPSARSMVLCRKGERLWAMGSPMTQSCLISRPPGTSPWP